ncbi:MULTISPECIES: metallophosphoesterase [unclassified Clostridium]|uniref:metallophosphoesterase n=1 Tax=unclassified Clostridium TaxID=2614128 RepID=UPI003217796F
MNIKKLIIVMILLIFIITFCYWQNNNIVVTNIDYVNSKIPSGFNGYKILQISDLHNKEFGANQKNLISLTKEINPDIIVITGDLIDSRRTNKDNMNIATSYIKSAVDIAPVYYVSGNHESRSDLYDELKIIFKEYGVINMDNIHKNIQLNGVTISLLGLADICFNPIDNYEYPNSPFSFNEILGNLKTESKNNFTILLSHRPELITLYAKENIDLVFSGHAHGGQIRLPFSGGIIAPDQGFFPKYTSGIHRLNSTSLVISRGLGNSLAPQRIFNRPELVVVTLSN